MRAQTAGGYASVERWLLEEVAPVYDAMRADPDRAIPIDEAFASVRGRHAERMKTPRRAP